jgi:hypothetical protein
VGDGALGYAATRWGVIVHGAFLAYDLGTTVSRAQNSQASGSGEGWFLSASEADPVSIEVRASVEGAYIDTTTFTTVTARPSTQAPPGGFFKDETSTFARGTVLGGARFRPSSRIAASGLFGAGFQQETYSPTTVDPSDPNFVSLADSTQTTLRLTARLRSAFGVARDKLSIRLAADASSFAITRDDQFLRIQTGGYTQGSARSRFRETQVDGRLAVDVDAFTLLGLVPSAFVGLDFIRMRTVFGATNVVVPLVGIGITTPIWPS